jgi:hypothetical protein
MRYLRLLSWVAGAAWAIEPAKAQVILDVLVSRATGAARADDDDVIWRMSEAAERRRDEPREGIAVVPVTGVISPRVHVKART